jgi:hypothetical protein
VVLNQAAEHLAEAMKSCGSDSLTLYELEDASLGGARNI